MKLHGLANLPNHCVQSIRQRSITSFPATVIDYMARNISVVEGPVTDEAFRQIYLRLIVAEPNT